jgi:hypothetical protein
VAPIVLTVDPDRASYPVLDPSLAAEVRSDLRVVRTDSFEPLRWLAAVAGKKAVPHAGFAGAKDGVVQRIMRWVRGNLMLPDARRGWVKYAVEAATGIIQAERIGTIVITSPPHSSQLIGLRLKERFRYSCRTQPSSLLTSLFSLFSSKEMVSRSFEIFNLKSSFRKPGATSSIS